MPKESTVGQIAVFFSATSSLPQSKAVEASFVLTEKQKQSHQVPGSRLAEAITHVRHL